MTLVPLRLYFKDGRAKVELGLARGKKPCDKRAAIRERDEPARYGTGARAIGIAPSKEDMGATGFDGDQ